MVASAKDTYLSEPDFRLLFESIPGLYMVLSPDLLIIGASNAYLAATMVKREDVIGRPLFEIFPDNPADIGATGVSNLGASLRRVIDEGVADTMAVQKYDVRRPQSDGGEFEIRYWSPTNSPVFGADGRLAFIVHRAEDVTEYIRQKQLENEQFKLTQELQSRTETMAAEIYSRAQELQVFNKQLQGLNRELESFSYSISHDLRAPLRAIDGYSLMLETENGAQLDDEGRRCLSLVRSHSKRMCQLIDDLLHFAKLGRQSLHKQELDMNALVREVIEEALRNPLQPMPEIIMEPLPQTVGDGALLRQVWKNLISNAFKYSSKTDAPAIRISGRREGAELIYSVADNGTGFDMAYYDKLFGVFERLHRADEYSGTGVGLAIVKRVVERHDGRVWAEGVQNQGAVFYFALPG